MGMDRFEALERFLSGYWTTESEKCAQALTAELEENREEITARFESALREMLQALAMNPAREPLHTVECSPLVSGLLAGSPGFVAEGYGEEWYLAPLARHVFPVSRFETAWRGLRERCRKEDKRYMGKIEPGEADRYMIAWLMRYTQILFPYFSRAVQNIKTGEDYQNAGKSEPVQFAFGAYRGMNETV